MAEFARITERLRDAPMTAKSTRDYQRMMFAGAHDEVPGPAGPRDRAAAAARSTPG